jgi:hypothetical protein
MYTESQIYTKNTFIYGWTSTILAKSSKTRRFIFEIFMRAEKYEKTIFLEQP